MEDKNNIKDTFKFVFVAVVILLFIGFLFKDHILIPVKDVVIPEQPKTLKPYHRMSEEELLESIRHAKPLPQNNE